MPRDELEKTQPVRVRIRNADLARIDDLYQYVGIHGKISEVVRAGTRLQIFIEEVQRERVTTTDDVRAAIHTLQVAVDRRDREPHDKSEKSSEDSIKQETASKESNSTDKKSTRKRTSKKSRSIETINT